VINRPMCPKGQRKPDSPCIFCEDWSYCAHQFYCPDTGQYENTGFRECRKRQPDGQALPKEEKTGTELIQKGKKETGIEGKEHENGTQKTNRKRRRRG